MTMFQRAAQFAPFAALTGHDAAIEETARLTDEELDMSENGRELLDRKLSFLMSYSGSPSVTITYFVPDERKHGGAYNSVSGMIRKVDLYEQTLVMTDGKIIAFNHITDLDSEIFDGLEL